MSYKVFLTDSIECLENEELLGEAEDFQTACKIISAGTPKYDGYWRFVMGKTATFVDYGSWSKFAAIVPPVSKKEMMGDTKS